MTNDGRNIDKLFRDGLKGMREKPPVHAWNKLDRALGAAWFSKKMYYYRLAAASVLILMAFGAGFYFANYLNNPNDIAEKEVSGKSIPIITQSENESNISFVESDESSDFEPIEAPGLTGFDQPDDAHSLDQTPDYSEVYAISKNTRPLQDETLNLPKEDNLYPEDGIEYSQLSTLAFIEVSELNFRDDVEVSKGSSLFIARNQHNEPFYNTLGLFPDDYNYNSEAKDNKWSVGAQFAPTYSYREISPNYGTNPTGSQNIQNNLNNSEEALHSYAGGLNVDYNFSGNWSLQSGMYVSQIGQVNNNALEFKQYNNELLLNAINTSTGKINVAFERVPENVKKIVSPKDTIGVSVIDNLKVVQHFDLFEIPFLVKYKLLSRKFSINFSGGLSPAYLLKNSTYIEMDDHKYDIGDAGNLNSLIVNTSLGLGLEYFFTKQFSVNFEPTFKYALNPINNNSDFSYHPYYLSWFTGIRLKIN